MKIIAFYLPQFHSIPENDQWWGEGFTEWENLKSARPLFKDHKQPVIPYEQNYYNLLQEGVLKWQVELALKYGIHAFCFYHYWFDSHLLLEKPVRNFLNDSSLKISFCFSWANEPWTKAWVSKENEVLISQNYGDVDMWEQHFQYLVEFFKDDRYIKIDNKPMFIIYRPNQISNLEEMIDYFNISAIKNGFDGIHFSYQQIDFDLTQSKQRDLFSSNIEFQPTYAFHNVLDNKKRFIENSAKKINNILYKYTKIDFSRIFLRKVRKFNYDILWEAILQASPNSNKSIPGCFVGWDNTPRRAEKGRVVIEGSPEKFQNYLEKLIVKAKTEYKTDYIFITAWNEWGEGCYLEPDTENKFEYLEAIRSSLIKTNEFLNNKKKDE